jgi:hypothetical protein
MIAAQNNFQFSRSIRRSALACVTLLLSLTSQSCTYDEEQDNRTPIETTDSAVLPIQPDAPRPSEAPETFVLAHDQIPAELNANNLQIYFSSNDRAARFECRWDKESAFVACASENAFQFVDLADDSRHQFEVRAISPAGIKDSTPAKVAFRVNKQSGAAAYRVPSGEELSADKIRTAVEQQVQGRDSNLLLGPFFAVRAPSYLRLVSFSTSQTLNSDIYALGQLRDASDSHKQSFGVAVEGCQKSWESELAMDDGQVFCESHPTINQWNLYLRPMAHDHVELVQQGLNGTLERLSAAAFGVNQDDRTASQFQAASQCRGAHMSGRATIPATMAGVPARQINVDWCYFQNGSTGWWQSFSTWHIGPEGMSPRVAVAYGISSERGILRPEQFLRRVQQTAETSISALPPHAVRVELKAR